jgi:hypothetical protein
MSYRCLRPGIRKMIYFNNALDALTRSLRKIIKTRGSFPALNLLYLAIKNAGLHWHRGVEWTACNGRSEPRVPIKRSLMGWLVEGNLPFSSSTAFQGHTVIPGEDQSLTEARCTK